jgi:polyisoprenoid-binding protein YceI
MYGRSHPHQQRPGVLTTSRVAYCLILALLWCAAPAAAQAQQLSVRVDPAKSKIEFALHASLHTVHGTLRAKPSALTLNQQTGEITGTVLVDATTADTGNQSRDSKMHRDVLQSMRYPDISFTSLHVDGAVAAEGTSSADVKGVLNMHGEEHEITAHLTIRIDGRAVAADATFPVKYVDWGMKNPSTVFLRVSDTVQVTVHLEGELQKAD